jgi:DNA-binding XRE family transcriptional regulator
LSTITIFFVSLTFDKFGQTYAKNVEVKTVFGLGKRRSKFGKWLDKRDITQGELAKKAGVGDMTISRICNDDNYIPKHDTIFKIRKALEKLGHNAPDDFWM